MSMDVTPLAAETLGIFNPHLDPSGNACRALLHADPSIRSAWVESLFKWSSACQEAERIARDHGRGVGITMTLFDIWPGENETRIEYEIAVRRPGGESFSLNMTDDGETFAAAMFLAGQAWRIAGYVIDEIEIREQAAAT
ncbi:MAG: hypothetical protein M9924_07795 [Rhizobiaceae bacterium]|nr:hypothetical protein [Rhizobiaceae bacterium]